MALGKIGVVSPMIYIGCKWVQKQTRGALQHTQTAALDRLATWTKLSYGLAWIQNQQSVDKKSIVLTIAPLVPFQNISYFWGV